MGRGEGVSHPLGREVDKMVFRVPSNPNHSVTVTQFGDRFAFFHFRRYN